MLLANCVIGIMVTILSYYAVRLALWALRKCNPDFFEEEGLDAEETDESRNAEV